jgi:hypothetical protein
MTLSSASLVTGRRLKTTERCTITLTANGQQQAFDGECWYLRDN